MKRFFPPRLRCSLLAALLFGLFVCVASSALAEPTVPRRAMGITGIGAVQLDYSARDLMNAEAQKKLDSGLPQRMVVQHFLYARGAEPVAVAGHSCKVVYDLWQAVYRVEYEVIGSAVLVYAYRTRQEVLDRCLVMRAFPLGKVEDLKRYGRVYVASLIELNPLSSSTLARIRRWLARPRGDYNLEGKSFFGSFVSLFVNDRIGSAERILRLRSQDVETGSWR